MTALRNIDRHNLSRAFASLLADPADARTICDETIDETPNPPIPIELHEFPSSEVEKTPLVQELA